MVGNSSTTPTNSRSGIHAMMMDDKSDIDPQIELTDMFEGDEYVAFPEGTYKPIIVTSLSANAAQVQRSKQQMNNLQPGPEISADDIDPVPYIPIHPRLIADSRRRGTKPSHVISPFPARRISVLAAQPNAPVQPPHKNTAAHNGHHRLPAPLSRTLPPQYQFPAPNSARGTSQPTSTNFTLPPLSQRPPLRHPIFPDVPPNNIQPDRHYKNTRNNYVNDWVNKSPVGQPMPRAHGQTSQSLLNSNFYVPPQQLKQQFPIQNPQSFLDSISSSHPLAQMGRLANQHRFGNPPFLNNQIQNNIIMPIHDNPQTIRPNLNMASNIRPWNTDLPGMAQLPLPSLSYAAANDSDFRPRAQPVRSAYDDFLRLAQETIPGIDVTELISKVTTNPHQPIQIPVPNGINAATVQEQLQQSLEKAITRATTNVNDGRFGTADPIYPTIPPSNQTSNIPPIIPQKPSEEDMAEEDMNAEVEQDDDFQEVETYAEYSPAKVDFGKPHPDPVVETSSLSTVEPPDIHYELSLPEKIIEKGYLSALQLETVIYACQQHKLYLADGKSRRGFLIGDGAGVGKGRQIAGIIYENWLCGRKKSIWLSVSSDLKLDAERDLKDIGAKVSVHLLGKFPYGKKINISDGVIFTTYSGLVSKSQTIRGPLGSRLGQLTTWAGPNYDGVIIFDECHKAKNISINKLKKSQSKAAEFVLELQNKLPKARIVYASATGASETRHLGYMMRLGIWGVGTPYEDFTAFCESIEKGGVGAMELVAVDLKMRGSYIARQLSFKTTTFQIHEADLDDDFIQLYDDCVKMWSIALHNFNEAVLLIGHGGQINIRSLWATFWSAHQRFFKYLCIAAKVPHVVDVAKKALLDGKCVVVGLQSTGEAKTLEAIEEGEINDFISTARATFESLVDNYFPAPETSRRIRKETAPSLTSNTSDISSKTEISETAEQVPLKMDPIREKNEKALRELAEQKKIKEKKKSNRAMRLEKRRSRNNRKKTKRVKVMDDSSTDTNMSNPLGESSSGDSSTLKNSDENDSSFEYTDSSEESSDVDSEGTIDNEDFKEEVAQTILSSKRILESDSDSDIQITAVKKKSYDVIFLSSDDEGDIDNFNENENDPIRKYGVQLTKMRDELYDQIDRIGPKLPNNTLDDLIHRLGGPEKVAEMTGRKGQVVKGSGGRISYKNRNESDAYNDLNVAEKDRFMRGEKLIAIISEAASSGISLQADKRVANTRRRVHITIELPWSADRAIQQFGRTHRSNQLSGPEYVFVISKFAGEKRFASVVAKRLESLGALTHGDRRATAGGSGNLDQFNISGRYCKQALTTLCEHVTVGIGKVIPQYDGNFRQDAQEGFLSAGLAQQGYMFQTEPQATQVNHFLNRLLGMRVKMQNALFQLFSDYMDRIILHNKVRGLHDGGILELNHESGKTRIEEPENFELPSKLGKVKCCLRTVLVERGISWSEALELYESCESKDSRNSFYLSCNPLTNSQTVMLCLREPGKVDLFRAYKPNIGRAVKPQFYSFLCDRSQKIKPERAEQLWDSIFTNTDKSCIHMCLFNSCKRNQAGLRCDMGLRHRKYTILSGEVLTTWPYLEKNVIGLSKKIRIVRLKLDENNRVIGPLIHQDKLEQVRNLLIKAESGL